MSGEARGRLGPALSAGDEVESPEARYEVLGLLGSGADGAVYLALQRGAEREMPAGPVSGHRLCTLKAVTTEAAAERLSLEAALLATLDHPGVPRPLEVFAREGMAYLAAEHRPGRTLERLLAEARGPLPPQDVVAWALQVTEILEYLHSRSAPVIHRDVKPSNLLLADDGRILLLDFGAARRYAAHKSGDTLLLGSPEYAAPEQFQATAQSGPYTDVWGLGATCYRLLTGRGPDRLFTFPPLREVNPHLPVSLESVLERALQYEPERRYRSAAEMRESLARALSVLQWQPEAGSVPWASPQVAAAAAALPRSASGRSTAGSHQPAFTRTRGGRVAQDSRDAGERLMVLASLLSPVISTVLVGFTVYLALATRSPLPFARQPLGLDKAGSVVEMGLGNLVVSSEPDGAQVELDGAPLQNRTPLRLSQLAAGEHQLTFRLPGYAAAERSINVQAGETAGLSVGLTPLVRLALGRVGDNGTWAAWDGRALKPHDAEGLFLRLDPEGLPDAASGQGTMITLQAVLRLPDRTARTLYSGPYAWSEPRRLRLLSAAPGFYTVEATVLGPDIPPVTRSVTFRILPSE